MILIWQQLYLSSIFNHQVWSYHGLMGKREQQSVGLIGILKKASEEKGISERTQRPVSMKISYHDHLGSEKRPHFLLKGLG